MLQIGNYPLQYSDVIAGIRQFPQNSEKKLKLKIEQLLNCSEHVTDETDVSNADWSQSSENQTCRMVTSLNHPTARSVEC